ncbi:MAG TPA: prephenate dehydrogenase/arogenate dehydrogenase family protein [Methanoregulaceae archaeon]|nr:prephenate dehydrogenase/arogenate dehydrogenase family protein [Methanoregulaceae archaeon]HQJ87435.1 prephenate dehydrogenase/arogenate dehydrogenase family protein [Methanoregulaceae archaeon]
MSVRVGILGGTGGMGRLFARVFQEAGWEVSVRGRTAVEPLATFLARQDVVVVSVPIEATVEVIARVAPHLRPDQLLCDLTSLKVAPVAEMSRSPAPAVGLHPMFGPGVASLVGQTIVVTPATATEAECAPLLDLLRRAGARLTFSTPERHDRMMAVVQGLTHSLTLVMAETMRRLGCDLDEVLSFTSPVYRIELGIAGRLLAQDPGLYREMLRANPHVLPVLAACSGALDDLRDAVAAPGPGPFTRYFEENAAAFAEYAPVATAETDRLIRCLVEP